MTDIPLFDAQITHQPIKLPPATVTIHARITVTVDVYRAALQAALSRYYHPRACPQLDATAWEHAEEGWGEIEATNVGAVTWPKGWTLQRVAEELEHPTYEAVT
jgi:hypothetical protein